MAALETGLFDAALLAREAWAALNRDRLIASMRKALTALETAPTVRYLERRKKVWEDLLALFPAWGCTLLSLGNAFPLEAGAIDRVVIDEAGQCHPAYAVSALYRAGATLIVGDVNQLEPIIELTEQDETRVLRRLGVGVEGRERLGPYRAVAGLGVSAQSLATRACAEVPTLRDHFRCQREIIQISNNLCGYDLIVRTPRRALQASFLRGPILGLPVKGEQVSYLGSWRNDAEGEQVVALVRALLRSGVRPDQIAALTPYRGQHRALEAAMRREGVPLAHDVVRGDDEGTLPLAYGDRGGGVALGTLHRFQGGERDVVILSAVVTRSRSLPFMNGKVNLINVAVSRARCHLIVVCDPDVLEQGRVTGELVRAVPDEAWLRPASRSRW